MGKAIASEAINRKNDYINPVIRIAVASVSYTHLNSIQRGACHSPHWPDCNERPDGNGFPIHQWHRALSSFYYDLGNVKPEDMPYLDLLTDVLDELDSTEHTAQQLKMCIRDRHLQLAGHFACTGPVEDACLQAGLCVGEKGLVDVFDL